jgi:hypothetical protein
MSVLRSLGVTLLTALLVLTLVSGNVLAAAHLTVLDPGFVNDTLEEEDGYGVAEDAVVEAAGSEAPGGAAGPIDTQALLRDAVDRAYLQNQTERNVEELYAYLHGERDTLNLTVDTRPLKADVGDAVEAQVRNATVAELLAASGTELPGPVNESTVERMTENESGYEAVKEEFRQRVRERVLDEAVDEAWAETTDDQKLALVVENYNPDDYTAAEKDAMVTDREEEIRAALRERIRTERSDELDDRVDTTLAELNESVTADAPEGDGLEAAAAGVQATFAEALTTDMSYDEFRTQLDAEKAAVAEAAGEQAAATLDEELPDTLSLTQGLDRSAREGLEQAQTTVVWLDRLAVAIPLLALVLVGLLYLLTRSGQTVAASLGVSLLVAGLPVYLSLGTVQTAAEDAIREAAASGDGGPAQAGSEFLLGALGQLFGRVGAVSLAFAVAGAVSLAVWLALRYDLVGGRGGETAPHGTESGDD